MGTASASVSPGHDSVVVAIEMPAGVRVGHWTGDGTGVTVVLPPPGTVGSGEVRGGAPATREFELLRPERMVDRVDAVVLSGGSAFGLAAGDGVMRALRDRGEGLPTVHGPVPIVVGMSIFDASVATTPPDADAGRAALLDAVSAPTGGVVRTGRIGAGTGAATSRWLGRLDPGGFGAASAHDPSGAVVTAFAVVNSLGSILAPDGRPLLPPAGDNDPRAAADSDGLPAAATASGTPTPATTGGTRAPATTGSTPTPAITDGTPTPASTTGTPVLATGGGTPISTGAGGGAGGPADSPDGLAGGSAGPVSGVDGPPPVATPPVAGAAGGGARPFGSSGRENTTIVVVATDAVLSKTECLLLAQSGHDGMARALHPSHTRFDGDAVVALATGTRPLTGENDLDTIRATAIEVVAAAIRNAVVHAA
ncbi:L-aminopeptidase/D-esterase-like protein [Catenuloplanes nepalensis]|uniref:L-aminopeptidase/D-esterase-like protein n=1 Tax=Catenuloplanes nepalensis TaxID=587533 RepID=A0ABT9MZI1_9ACTN|nr:P1 family peptidase [Catenuloplanes nepalensis]MDP9796606.1 L-aminopeptidase/D-esterase-like protein [Catenuloplanes nepalensis]